MRDFIDWFFSFVLAFMCIQVISGLQEPEIADEAVDIGEITCDTRYIE